MLLRPGRTCDEALELLKNVTDQGLNDVQNSVPHFFPSGGEEDASRRTEKIKHLHHVVNQYDQWTLQATKKLQEVFADRSITTRLRGERYASVVFGDHTANRLAQLLNFELNELRTYFMDLGNELYRMKAAHAHHQGRTVVLDTNDLLHYSRYDKVPWAKLYGKNTVVVIPHVVVDEIDKKSYATSDAIRRRARGVFALLEQTLTEQRQGEATAGGVRIEVLLDEPQHVRLPNNDDEIVARACELQQSIAPVQVTVLTGDNGMRARALAWGLDAEKLPEKYKIEQITARQKDEYLQSITAPEEPEPVSAS